MSQSYRNPPNPLPSSRLRVGDFVVDVPLREVAHADGSRTRITLKSLEVLLALAANPGQVVSRDALLGSVWAGTMPTNDVVTQAVAGLRKALADDHGAPRYLETIPKSGYRLLAAVQWLPEPADPVVDASTQAENPASTHPSAKSWRRMPFRDAAIGLVAILLVALGWMVVRERGASLPSSSAGTANAPNDLHELPYTLLTSRPGPETQPALSPDGAMLAYAMPPDTADAAPAIFLQAAQPTPPRQLTMPPEGHSDHLPRWSPDGRQLMFARIDDKGACELQRVPVSGGAARVVGRCDRINGRYDWLPDGGGVIAGLKPEAQGRAARLSILRLDSGRWQAMSYAAGPDDVDFDARFSPDGSQLVFRRGLSHSDLWLMPAAGGTPSRLTQLRGSINGWDWTPDGRALLVGFVGNTSRLYRHDLASGRTRALARFSGSGLDVAARGNAMVFTIDDARVAMFRYPLPLREGARPEPLFASTGKDVLPSPSPDGRWVAFHSDRSRDARLWLGEPGNPDHLRMIDGFVPISRHPPQWSDDGRRLLVIGEAIHAEAGAGARLYEIDVASGRATSLAQEGVPYFAQYLPERQLLLLVDRGAGRLSLRILDTATAPQRVIAHMDDVGEARFDPASGDVFFVRSSGPGLWRTGRDLRLPRRVDETQPTAYWARRWAVREGRPFVLRTAAPACLASWRWLGEPGPTDVGCLDRERRGLPALAPVVSRDGKWLYATMVPGQENSDIGLIDSSDMVDLYSITD